MKPARSVQPSSFFVLRTPLLPLDELHALSQGITAASAEESELAAALAHDHRLLRERLKAALLRPEAREALFVASPSLDESLPIWLEQPDSERGKKVERTLIRYFARMCARPTPFGLFAGCSVGRVAAETRFELPPRADYRRHTRLDGDYLSSLCDSLGRDAAVRATLTYRPSTSLYRAAGRLRYAEARMHGKLRAYHLVAVEPSEYLEATLERARDGAKLDLLAQALTSDEITLEEATAFVHELVDAQLLVPDLEPQVTGDEPVHDLIAQLGDHPAATCLAQVRDDLAALDARAPGSAPSLYRTAADRLRALPVEVELSRLFQVDLVKPAQATLGAAPLDELTRVVTLLHRLAKPVDSALGEFRDAFVSRYEQREVPLAEVLDEESGIGFERQNRVDADVSPLLDGLPLAFGAPGESRAGRLFELLSHKLDEALRNGAEEVILDEKELERYAATKPPRLPDSLAAMGTLFAPSAQSVDAGEFRLFLEGVMGPSGANLLGRFCHGDPTLLELVRDHLRQEEARRPEAIFAEIVHLPEGRIGNVILRPLLREHEIAFLGRSGAPADRQLRLDDLTVSVVERRVVLRSRRLGKEIIPRLTTAHAFSNPKNLGVYRFLCALQYQDAPALGIGWGALEQAPYLPRLRIGKTFLTLQRWRLVKAELETLDGAARFSAMQQLRRRRRLPRWVTLRDGDNLLPIDLDNVIAVDAFVQLVKDRHEAILLELFGADGLVARGPEGAFTHELVVPLTATAEPEREARSPRAPVEAPLPRRLLPGSEWLYAKLYTGSATADEVLRDVVAPVVAEARASGAADAWFFIRYGDPDWHLRVRFHGDPRRLAGEVLPSLHAAAAPALDNGRLWKLQLDTYERELERYGGAHGMLASEQLFAADSDAVLGIVGTLAGDEAADARWRIALRGMDQLLDDLGFDLRRKHALLERCRDGFAREFEPAGPALPRGIGDKFRKERKSLDELLDRKGDDASPFAPALTLFAARSERLRPIAGSLLARAEAGRLTTTVDDLATSYLHMHANRLLRGSARAQERVLYDFLARLYEGRLRRKS